MCIRDVPSFRTLVFRISHQVEKFTYMYFRFIFQEKMYEFEQNKKNNLILYGITTKHPETSESLRTRIANIFRDHLNIRRDIPVQRATRVHTGPEVRGCRPVLVTFETFKDRETVLRMAKVLKKANVIVTEDLSKRTRESRQELRKFMRQVRQ